MRIAFKYCDDAVHIEEVSRVSFFNNSIIFNQYSCDLPNYALEQIKSELLANGYTDISAYGAKLVSYNY